MDAAHTGLPAVAQPDMFGAEAEEMPMEMDELAGPDAGASGEAGGPANLAGDVADDAGNEDEDADGCGAAAECSEEEDGKDGVA
jgi:hypothetical protein